MMKLINIILLLVSVSLLISQENQETSTKYPFGRLSPNAPHQVADYKLLIGTCDCESSKRKAGKSWEIPQKMTWTFKYIMNGTAVQDETIKEDGSHSGSIRQFVADSSKWYVHWYSSQKPKAKLSTWSGSNKGGDIVLKQNQKAPNGMDGFYRITFRNITSEGFDWTGAWINVTETIIYPTWKISCLKRE